VSQELYAKTLLCTPTKKNSSSKSLHTCSPNIKEGKRKKKILAGPFHFSLINKTISQTNQKNKKTKKEINNNLPINKKLFINIQNKKKTKKHTIFCLLPYLSLLSDSQYYFFFLFVYLIQPLQLLV